MQLQAGTVTDGNAVFDLANLALTKCTDRSEVQGIATELFSKLAYNTDDDATRLILWSKAYEAAVNNHNAFSSGPSPVVKLSDGSDHTLYPYSSVSTWMDEYISRHLLRLAVYGDGHDHAIFDPAPLSECPYNRQQNRVRHEALGLRQAGAQTYHQGGAKIALARLERLQAVCTEQAGYLTLMLAELHGAAAFYANTAKQTEFAVAHAQKSLEFYIAFQSMNVTDADDKSSQKYIGPRIAEAKEALAEYNRPKAPPPSPSPRP